MDPKWLMAMLAARYRLGGGGWAQDAEPQEPVPAMMQYGAMKGGLRNALDAMGPTDTNVEARSPQLNLENQKDRLREALLQMLLMGQDEQQGNDMADFGPHPQGMGRWAQ